MSLNMKEIQNRAEKKVEMLAPELKELSLKIHENPELGKEEFKACRWQVELLKKKVETGRQASTLSADGEYACRGAMAALEDMAVMLKEKAPADGTESFRLLKAAFDDRTKQLKQQADAAGKQLSNVFVFCEEAFGEGQEMLILVTELTISYYGAHFISRYGCREYFAHNKELLFYERQKEIITELEKLELED